MWASDGATGDRGEQSRSRGGGGIGLGLSEDATFVLQYVLQWGSKQKRGSVFFFFPLCVPLFAAKVSAVLVSRSVHNITSRLYTFGCILVYIPGMSTLLKVWAI